MILTCLGKEVQENQQTYIQMQLMLPVLYEDPKKGKQKTWQIRKCAAVLEKIK